MIECIDVTSSIRTVICPLALRFASFSVHSLTLSITCILTIPTFQIYCVTIPFRAVLTAHVNLFYFPLYVTAQHQ